MADSTNKSLAEREYENMERCYASCDIPVIYDVSSVQEYMVEMPDGIKLRTICFFPTGNQPAPLVFERLCYPAHEKLMRLHGLEFCKRGLGFAFQFCRGTGGSEGEWVPNTMCERTDGLATVQFLENLPQVSSLGYWGSSYMAMCGWAILEDCPSSVKTMYLTHYGTDRYVSLYESGLFRQDIMTGWAKNNAGMTIEANHLDSCAYRPQVSVDEDLWGVRLDWYRTWITSTQRTDSHWSEGLWGILQRAPAKAKIPLYIGGSWFDHHFGSTLKTYAALAEECKEQTTFRVGCWEHSFIPCLSGHPQEHLENNNVELALKWFLDILVHHKKPQKKIKLYTIGADSWAEYDAYPVPGRREMTLYLSGKPSSSHTGQLARTCSPNTEEVTFTYDPRLYVPSCGGESVYTSREQRGSVLQPPCGYRPDVLSFRSDPLDGTQEIIGQIQGKLTVKSSVPDTAFTIKIMEEFPGGKTYNLRSGIVTLAFRKGDGIRGTYTPGEVVEISIPTWDIAWRPAKGSRIRVDVSSSNFPEYAVHSNYPGGWAEQSKTQSAEQTIFIGGEQASKIIIPYIQHKEDEHG